MREGEMMELLRSSIFLTASRKLEGMNSGNAYPKYSIIRDSLVEWTNEKRGDLADKLMRLHLYLAAFILGENEFFLSSPSLSPLSASLSPVPDQDGRSDCRMRHHPLCSCQKSARPPCSAHGELEGGCFMG